MNGQSFSLGMASSQSKPSPSWLPASYRAHAVQEDVRCAPMFVRAQTHFKEISEHIARTERTDRSVGIAVILAAIFGPIGILYATEFGALAMATVDSLLVLIGHSRGLPFAWAIGIVWAAVSTAIHQRDSEELS